ncbi:MAG: hypothetical protein J4F36_06815 [Nitrosopumilaceae archaeon]|nr:hypothetical protein [Nitrosopumilaceae archaeon]
MMPIFDKTVFGIFGVIVFLFAFILYVVFDNNDEDPHNIIGNEVSLFIASAFALFIALFIWKISVSESNRHEISAYREIIENIDEVTTSYSNIEKEPDDNKKYAQLALFQQYTLPLFVGITSNPNLDWKVVKKYKKYCYTLNAIFRSSLNDKPTIPTTDDYKSLISPLIQTLEENIPKQIKQKLAELKTKIDSL